LKAKHKVGFYHWWNFFAFQTRILRPLHYPEALRQLSLLRAIGHEERDWSRFTNSKVRKTTLEFLSSSIPEVASMSLRPAPKKTEKNLLIAPGSVWPTKQWTASGFKEVAQYFSSKGFRVCFVGSEQERRLCEEMARAIPGCENLAGQLPWPELLELMHQSAALVCNDSGAMHLATLVNLPIVSIFGPTTLDLGYRPWTEQAVVVQKDLTCRPCGKHGAKVCPLGTHACMKQISSQTVIEAVEFLIEKTHPTH
jgi:heptosyltransferase-2